MLGLDLVPAKYLPVLVTGCLFAAMFVVGGIRYEGFATGQIILNVFIDNAFLLVVAVGMTFVILLEGIDLSVGSVVALLHDDLGEPDGGPGWPRTWWCRWCWPSAPGSGW